MREACLTLAVDISDMATEVIFLVSGLYLASQSSSVYQQMPFYLVMAG